MTYPISWRACAVAVACAAAAQASQSATIVAPALAPIAQQRATTTAQMSGTATVAFSDGKARPWTARSSAAWLVIDTPSSSGSALRYHVDPAAATAGVPNWDTAVATVTLSSTGLADAKSQLTFRRQLPEITMLTPAQVLPGQGATLTLSGRGLLQLSSIGQILVGGQPATAGTLVSDSAATVELSARAAGTLQVRVPNVLNQPAAYAQVAVAEPFGYASVPNLSGTSKTSIVYDPSRKAVYAADWHGSALVRYKFDGTAWTTTVVPWAGAWRVQMSPDRQTLYVLATNGLSEVDPATLKPRVVHKDMTGFQGFYFHNPLPLTNDLRLWASEGTQYFDLRRKVVAYAAPREFGQAGTQTLIQTPDGGHLYTLTGSVSPTPPNGWFSTATHTTRTLPEGLLNYHYDAAFDKDGRKGVFSGQSVYWTSNWSLIGLIQPPARTQNFGNAVMSPDGMRVYALNAPEGYPTSANRVTVYTTWRTQTGTTNLVMLGTIAVPDPAAVCNGEYDCDSSGRLAIDATGSQLFWAGNKAFTVIPIPAALQYPGTGLN